MAFKPKVLTLVFLLAAGICPRGGIAATNGDIAGLPHNRGAFIDLALDDLFGAESNDSRNPFAPGFAEDEVNPSALLVEGLVIGPDVRLALVSGQILAPGDRVGRYTVDKIGYGKVVLKQLEDEFVVPMASFSAPLKPVQTGKFLVEFSNADIRKALAMLAKADNVNLILPEDTSGKVSVSFINTGVRDVIASILRVNDLEYAFENDIMRVGKADQFKDGSDLKAVSVPLKYATAKDLEAKIKTFLSDRGSTVSDERTNTIIVKDHANVIDSAVKFLAEIDRKDPQVSIEAKIIDASSSFARSLGIQWGLTTGPSNVVVRGNTDVGTISGSPHTGSIANFGAASPTSGLDVLIGRLPGNMALEAQLSAAESTGQIRIISKPNVTTINNKAAKIRSGVKIYVKTDGGSDQGPQLQEIDTGVELSVTPQITLNRMIKLTIDATESEADFSRTVDGIPAILDNTATTTILVPDGETAVIGGLVKVKTTKEGRGVPGLSRVPVLGWLFKNSSRKKDNNELMLFITPRILDDSFFKMDKSNEIHDSPTTLTQTDNN